jgi:hypothetical protein
VAGLEQVMDAATAVAVAADHGAALPPPGQVRELETALRGLADEARPGIRPPKPDDLPDGEPLRPVADAVRRVQAVLG